MTSALDLSKEQIHEAFKQAYHDNVSTCQYLIAKYQLTGIESCVLREVASAAYFFAMGVLTSKKSEIINFMAYHLNMPHSVVEHMYAQAAVDCLRDHTSTPVQRYDTPIIP